jgi:hypothetical protein
MANLIPAFTEMKPLDMMSSLKERDRAVSKGPNFLRRFTHGLQNLFLELQTARKFPPSMNVKSFTDESGRIRKSAQLPALSKRYITTNLIGEGTFSQIYAATDSYTRGKVVAVKCLHAGFDILGQREAAYLQFLNRRNARGSRYFVGILEAFYFDNHVCLALEHFRTTLATFMHAVIVAPPAVTISPHLANVHRPVPRSTYMVGSSSGNNSAELKGGSEYTSNPDRVVVLILPS